MTAIAILVAILQVGAFVLAAIIGGRAADKIGDANRWFTFILAGVILVAVGSYVVANDGVIANEWVRAIGAAALGFAGGLVVRVRNRIIAGK